MGRKKRADRFPLTLHKTGQYCKLIRGKMHYFGKDRVQALQKYRRQAADLHAGKTPLVLSAGGLTLLDACNLYMQHQDTQLAAGEIKYAHFYGVRLRLRAFAESIGPSRPISSISIMDIQQYRAKLIADGMSSHTVNNHVRTIKALFAWALDHEVIDKAPKLKAVKAVKTKKVERQTFAPDEIRRLLELANTQMRAMILLGLNCSFGCTDCAELKWEHLNLDTGRVDFPRGKTGVGRNFLLWSETVQALRAVPVKGELVFYTHTGKPWVRRSGKSVTNAVTTEFTKLLRKAGIATDEKTSFYALRRTAATIAAQTGNVFAVQALLGHADLKMASTYVQRGKLTPQTDRAVQHAERWLNLPSPDSSGSPATSPGPESPAAQSPDADPETPPETPG